MSFGIFFFYWLLYNLVNIKWICLVFAVQVSTPATNTPSSLTFPVMFCDCCENCKVNSFEIKSCLLGKSKLDLWLALITGYILLEQNTKIIIFLIHRTCYRIIALRTYNNTKYIDNLPWSPIWHSKKFVLFYFIFLLYFIWLRLKFSRLVPGNIWQDTQAVLLYFLLMQFRFFVQRQVRIINFLRDFHSSVWQNNTIKE